MNINISTIDRQNCPQCNIHGYILFPHLPDRMYNAPGYWNIRECKNCGLLWLDPIPAKNEVWKIYNYYYTHSKTKSNILFFARPFVKPYVLSKYGYIQNKCKYLLFKLIGSIVYIFPTEKIEIDFNILELSNKEKGKLLDIGCGNGAFMKRMISLGWECEGIDFDKNAIEACLKEGLNVSLGDLSNQNIQNNSFDVITISHVIEHVDNPFSLLSECYHILKPGGQIVIATPNSNSWLFRSIFHSYWYPLEIPRHFHIFNLTNLSTLINKVGFEIICAKTTHRNEFWVYLVSKSIKKTGLFNMSKGKKNKISVLEGKFWQFIVWLILLFKDDLGGELFFKAKK